MTEPLVWEATTPVYTRWISERRYRNLRPYARRWYRPICPQCGPASGMEARQGGDVKQAPSRSDDSPPGRPKSTPSTSLGEGQK